MNTNKLNLASIIIVFMLMGCNSNEDNQTDELLKGTLWEWKYLNATPSDNINQVEIYSDLLTILSQYFSDIKYSIGPTFSTEKIDTSYHQGEHFNAHLKFENEECEYSEECFREATISHIEKKIQTYILEENIYINEYINMTLQIKSDGAHIYINGEEKKIYPLDNFKTNKYIGETIVKTTDEKIHKSKDSESFHFQRTENEIIFSNKNKKWIGILNPTDWTMSLVQILPERKDLHTFTLK